MLKRMGELAKRPASWAWIAAVVTAAGASVSPELRELLVAGVPVILQAVLGN
ncbi:hypothetical protein [Thalassobaculum sp.]|uniref:hypothetical protein n=1 Tax=Thalassobaculum sp. TaxID=2022740 RepID=UPI0032EDC08A